MDKYELLTFDEVIDYLDAYLVRPVNRNNILEIVKQYDLPIVFKYQGLASWLYYKPPLSKEVQINISGYFQDTNRQSSLLAFKGFTDPITVTKATIYKLHSFRFRPVFHEGTQYNLDGAELVVGDNITFPTGGRPLISKKPSTPNYVTIPKYNVGLLREDLDIFVSKMQSRQPSKLIDETEVAQSEEKVIQLEAKIVVLEEENKKLKKKLENRNKSENSNYVKKSAYLLIATMKDLLLNPDLNAYHYKADSIKSNGKPTQAGLANHIVNLKIGNLGKRTIDGIFSEANNVKDDSL